MKAAIVVFPGVNRDRDVARALRLASGAEPASVWHTETSLPAGTDLAVLPGGFSYGDYLRCGAIAARSPVMDAVRAHAARGGRVLAICNGCQVACEAGLLPGVLMRNAGQGLILVFVILALFLQLRLAIWVAIGIPVAFLGAVAFMPIADVSINMISLFAFLLVHGIVVDSKGAVYAADTYGQRIQKFVPAGPASQP